MRDLTSQFCNRFQDFQHFGSLFSFLIKPESSEDLNLHASELMHIENFQMQLIGFKASLLLTSKFVDLQKSLKTIENEQKHFNIAKLQTVTLFRPIRSLQCSW